MENAGIFMEAKSGDTLVDECERLCDTILRAEYPLPTEWRFRRDHVVDVLEQVRFRNETRVMRDVHPLVMPSPELLHLQGHPGLKHIAEGLNAEWTKCLSLCGPKSKPDATHGVSRFAFSSKEREILTSKNTCACEKTILPFYIGEVKSSERPIEEAELQAMHSASVAGNAVIQIFQSVSAAEELNRRVLTFSLSHNHRVVKIFAHFARIEGSKITFHRRQLVETDLTSPTSDWTRPYQITLAIREHFYPKHLCRIQDALSRQQGRNIESFTAQLGLEEDSLSNVSTPPSSQEDSAAKRASLSSFVKLQEENSRLRDQLLGLTQDHQQHNAQMERQFVLQIAENRAQKELLTQQKEMMERQLAQQEKLIDLLQSRLGDWGSNQKCAD